MNRQLGVRTLVLPAFVAAASALLLHPGLVGPGATDTLALHAMLATHN